MPGDLTKRVLTGALAWSLAFAPSYAQVISSTPNKSAVAIPNYTANGGLPKWQVCLSKVKAATGNCKLLVIGESTPAGYGQWESNDYSWNRTTAWPSQIAASLPMYGYQASSNGVFGHAGVGGVSSGGSAVTYAQYDARSTLNGWAPNANSFITAGGLLFFNDTNATSFSFDCSDTSQFVTALACQTDTFVYFPTLINTGDTHTILAGATNVGTVTDNTSSYAARTFTNTLGHNVWNVQCTTLGSVGCYFGAFYAYNSAVSQVIVLNAGWAGSNTVNWTNSSGAPWDPLLAIAAYAPDLCIIQLDGNDIGAGTSIPTFETNKEAIITACQLSGDAMIVTSQQFNPNSLTFTGSTATNVLTVTGSVANGNLSVGNTVVGAGIPAPCKISSLGTGTGQAGTYNLSCTPGTVGSEAMTGGGSYATQQAYIAADYVVATAKNVPILDWWASQCGTYNSAGNGSCPNGGWSYGDKAGWQAQNFGTNGIADPHLGPPAYGVLGLTLTQIITH